MSAVWRRTLGFALIVIVFAVGIWRLEDTVNNVETEGRRALLSECETVNSNKFTISEILAQLNSDGTREGDPESIDFINRTLPRLKPNECRRILDMEVNFKLKRLIVVNNAEGYDGPAISLANESLLRLNAIVCTKAKVSTLSLTSFVKLATDDTFLQVLPVNPPLDFKYTQGCHEGTYEIELPPNLTPGTWEFQSIAEIVVGPITPPVDNSDLEYHFFRTKPFQVVP